MNELRTLLENDNNPRKPRIIRGGDGEFTKKFLAWNRRQVREGRTTYYADNDFLYNPDTQRFIKKRFDRRYTTRRVETSRTRNLFRDRSVVMERPQSVFRREYRPQNYIASSFGNPDRRYQGEQYTLNSHSWLHYQILRNNPNISGPCRFILTVDNPDSVDFGNDNPLYNNVIIDQTINVELNMTKAQYENSPLFNLLIRDSPYPNIIAWFLDNGITCRFYITKSINISQNVVSQVFRYSPNNDCLIKPIYRWIEDKIQNASSKSVEKKYMTYKRKFDNVEYTDGRIKEGFNEVYKDGVPEDAIPIIGEAIQCEIIIDRPFEIDHYIHYIPLKKPVRTFKYLFTKENHVERITSENYQDRVEVDTEEDLWDVVKAGGRDGLSEPALPDPAFPPGLGTGAAQGRRQTTDPL